MVARCRGQWRKVDHSDVELWIPLPLNQANTRTIEKKLTIMQEKELFSDIA